MAARLLRRRSATAAWIYVAVACGILGTVVAARVLGLDEFGVFATALAAVGFFQVLLDLTVEESLTKYGFRYVAAEDWGRLRRLFRQMLLLKVLGGALATVILVGLAPFADEIFGADGLEQALLAAALLPLVQSTENVGAT
ncbi:MAG: oligosaccharide flippase family protein, partial [Thermoleophilia bacterium]|nr:oligosaccharide flippase family protein [Thermoleophilia bacterium]